MKIIKHLSKIFLAVTIVSLLSFSNIDKRHIGEWTGTDDSGKTATLILDSTNHATIVMNNQVLGGNEFEVDGQTMECKYEIDYTRSPIWLDIVMYNKTKQVETGRLKGIVKFITDTKMEFRLNYTGVRYDSFDPTDTANTIVLDKKIN